MRSDIEGVIAVRDLFDRRTPRKAQFHEECHKSRASHGKTRIARDTHSVEGKTIKSESQYGVVRYLPLPLLLAPTTACLAVAPLNAPGRGVLRRLLLVHDADAARLRTGKAHFLAAVEAA